MKNYKPTFISAIISAVVLLIASDVFDALKTLPILSFIYNILTFEIDVWVILLVCLGLVIVFNFLSIWENNRSYFLNYRTDLIGNIKWEWGYEKDRRGKWVIKDPVPLCPNCNTPTKLGFSSGVCFAKCPRCDFIIERVKDPDDVENVVFDNIRRMDPSNSGNK